MMRIFFFDPHNMIYSRFGTNHMRHQSYSVCTIVIRYFCSLKCMRKISRMKRYKQIMWFRKTSVKLFYPRSCTMHLIKQKIKISYALVLSADFYFENLTITITRRLVKSIIKIRPKTAKLSMGK